MTHEWSEKLAPYGGGQPPTPSAPDITGYTISAPTGPFRTTEDVLPALLVEQQKQTALLEAVLATLRGLRAP
jgi:hypothetical protein